MGVTLANVLSGQMAGSDGLRPTLAELAALQRSAVRRPPPRRGRYGMAGPAPAPQRGRGMEYAESREYVPGDDARHIDWRVTARSGRAHTKLFQAEREQLSLIVADTAPALYFGTRVRYKSVQAARAAAVAAWAAQRRGDRIAALRGSLAEAPVAPATGQRGVLRVLDALVRWYAQPPREDAGLPVALDHAGRLLRPGARLYVFADPASAGAVPLARWAALAAHHDVTAVLLVDPLETAPPSQALAFMAGDAQVQVDLGSAEGMQRWHQCFGEAAASLQRELAARGVRAHLLSTPDPSDAWMGGGVREGVPQ